MIKMKIAIVLTICLTANSFLFAQQPNDMLSKEEMNKEFDYLIELVSEVNPNLPIYNLSSITKRLLIICLISTDTGQLC